MRTEASGPRAARWRGAITLIVLLGALALAVLGRPLPAALPRDAPPELFSAGRASEVLEGLARVPHPVGSGEHECVRAKLVTELRALGLATWELEGMVEGVPLTNLLARLPGYASTGTILCLAHYDSVPSGPGAGDDGAGLVAWLEALRALRARRWQLRNDVLVLFSDGEELGLLGARLFARQPHALEELDVVVNLEAIGNGGPAVLFELGPRNGERVREYARVVGAPAATSLADAVYARMPNDTDMTVFLRNGVHGFNLALTAGNAAYHAPHDTPGNLDPQSLQHLGESALALLEALGERDLAAGLDAPDVSFHDLYGRRLLVWPRVLDVLAVALALGLVRATCRRERRAWRELGRACGRHALVCAGTALACAGVFLVLDALAWCLTPRLDWVAGNTTSVALLFAALFLGLCARAAGWPADDGSRGEEARIAWAAAAVLALLLSPGASYLFAWPLIAVGAAALLARTRRTWPCLGLAFALVLGLPILYLLLQLFARRPPVALLLIGGTLASGARLFEADLRTLGRRGGTWLAVVSGTALLGALVVARGLAWRQGALWP